MSARVRRARPEDADAVARLLHDFNTEFDEPTPGPERLAARVRQLLAGGEATILLAGEGPDGVAVMRLRPSIWTEGLECYLAELYVVPEKRGGGLGRALMTAVVEAARDAGADYVDLNTEDGDVAARALYESLGFEHTARYYEREV